jgi:hypothetical protein
MGAGELTDQRTRCDAAVLRLGKGVPDALGHRFQLVHPVLALADGGRRQTVRKASGQVGDSTSSQTRV